jgi:hypothetical protein
MEKVQRANNPKPITIDPGSATTLEELGNLWSQVVDAGLTEQLQAEFTKRKNELK